MSRHALPTPGTWSFRIILLKGRVAAADASTTRTGDRPLHAAALAHRRIDVHQNFALGLALSAFDAVATWAWLSLGVATEANPVLTELIDAQGVVVAMAIRALLGAVWFGGFRLLASRSTWSRPAELLSLGVLGVVAFQHLRILSHLLGT